MTPSRPTTPSHESGQITAEYVLIILAVAMTIALVGYGTSYDLCHGNRRLHGDQCGNVFVEISKALSESLVTLTTILKLPL
jgi:hypothetical protein